MKEQKVVSGGLVEEINEMGVGFGHPLINRLGATG